MKKHQRDKQGKAIKFFETGMAWRQLSALNIANESRRIRRVAASAQKSAKYKSYGVERYNLAA